MSMLRLTRRAFLGFLASLAVTVRVRAARPLAVSLPPTGLRVPLQVHMRVGLGHRLYLPIVEKE